MPLFDLEEIEQAVRLVHESMQPTPQHAWPLICEEVGANVWVKHENHTSTGSFKVRGAITFMDWLNKAHPQIEGIVTATRGNHGQGQAREATAVGLKAKIVVPFGNSKEKNDAMRAFGGDVIEFGNDFDEAKLKAQEIAKQESLFLVPPFHPQIVKGVSSYAYELFTEIQNLDCVYVPIGCGSGICSLITVRDALKLDTKIIGVVSDKAQAAKISFESGGIRQTASANTFADGMAVRSPVKEAFDIYSKGAERIVAVSDDEISQAMRLYYSATHNIAEGAGAASLAALMKEKDKIQDKKIAVVLTGSNIDTELYCSVLQYKTPRVI
ncbi:threonine dehydratase [Hahella ganghwensis]|uniref:threonine dehydratase n=1 Tax=Hahella ganghwensis TaxID=286420 RepID=UPI00036B23A4|nr:threonine dehydratase [Hahella ganghwensis]